MTHDGAALVETTPAEVTSSRVVGRYTLRALLGIGGMGEVWSAHDPGLDRVVAVKLVRADLANERTRARLAHEAQSLARINHPNVVAIHEVAAEGDLVYFVQELVHGVDLQRWLDATPRTWHQITSVFAQAGRGLAAAHDAGIVHRDFKPSNVLVGDDGRVRVGDFGLARPQRSDDGAADPLDSPAPTSGQLTETGAVLGTPLYMSPEQHLGHPPSPAGDQFSFCVSLYQALYRQLPFASATALDYALDAVRGLVREAPRTTNVPAWLHELVLRGLRAGGRTPYPSIHAVVDELAADRAGKRRRRLVLVGAALAVTLGGGVAFAAWRGGEAPCSGAPAELATVWNDAAKAAARDAFAATHLPYAPGAWTRAEVALDRYGSAWAAMHTDTCKATRVHGEQSEAALDLRMSCLRNRLQGLGAAVQLFGKADKQTVEKAATVAGSLAPLSECADVDALRAATPPPRDPVVTAKVDALRSRLATEQALSHAGKYKDALPLATAIVGDARKVEYPPVLADAALELAEVQGRLNVDNVRASSLRDAYVTARAAGLDGDAARAAANYAALLGHDPATRSDALWWLDVARAEAKRRPDGALETWLGSRAAVVLALTGHDDDAIAELRRTIAAAPDDADALQTLSTVLSDQGKFAEALVAARQALVQYARVVGPDHPSLVFERSRIASMLGALGQFDEAIIELRAALATSVRVLGEDAQDTMGIRFELAHNLSDVGKPQEALDEFRRALATEERSAPNVDRARQARAIAVLRQWIGIELGHLGKYDDAIAELKASLEARTDTPDDEQVAEARVALGGIYSEQSRIEDALHEYQIALDAFQRTSPGHPFIASIMDSTAEALAQKGELGRALDLAHHALALHVKSFGDDSPYAGAAHVSLGLVLERAGTYALALAEFQRALPSFVKAAGEASPDVFEVHAHVGRSLSRLGKDREAAAELTPALAGLERVSGPHHLTTANCRAYLGSTLVDLGDYDRAVAELERAAQDLVAGHDLVQIATTQFDLARARWGQHTDRRAAHALAAKARGDLAKLGPAAAPELVEVNRWLASH